MPLGTVLQIHDPLGLVDASPEEVGLASAGLARLTRLVDGWVQDGKIAGAITAVVRHGRLPFLHVSGMMDVESTRPMRGDALFRLYSMTKPITSVALMTLYHEGRFQLDQPIADFLPEFRDLQVFTGGDIQEWETAPLERPVTVLDVLTHTAGFAAGGRSVPGQLFTRAGMLRLRADGDLKDSWTLDDMMRALAALPLESQPGERWRYGVSPDVAARLCEVQSGLPFDRFLRERVLGPLGMHSTGYQVPPEDLDRLTTAYGAPTAPGGPLVALDTPADSRMATPKTLFSGSGGLVSTAADYVQFVKLLLGAASGEAAVLHPRTLRWVMTNHLPGGVDLAAIARGSMTETVMEGVGFGLGVSVLLDPVASRTIGTPGEVGWGGAASTAFFASPADGLGVVFMAQLRPSHTHDFRRALRAVAYGALLD